MTIEYELTLEDIVNFNEYHFTNSELWKKKITTARILLPVLLTLIILFRSTKKNFHFWEIIIAVLLSIIWVFYVKWRSVKSLKATAKRIYKEGNNFELLTTHKLTLTPECVIEQTENSKSENSWVSIEKIVFTNDYIFIYISSVIAHVIPLSQLENQDVIQEFKNSVEKYYQDGIVVNK